MSRSLNIIFAGTPAIALPTLEVLLASQHTVTAVYTQPDRPAGRGRDLAASPVKQFALQHHWPVFQPQTLRDPATQDQLVALKPDVLVVLAYGLILPTRVLQIPRYGCLNIHVSLLPRWRGAAPIQRAILAGDKKTGVSIIQMDEGLDTGPVFLQRECPISITDTSQTLHDRLAKLGAEALLEVLDQLDDPNFKPHPQDETHVCYASKLTKSEGKMNFTSSADSLARQVRAFNPWPMAYFEHDTPIRVWEALALEHRDASPGTIVGISKTGLDVATGHGVLRMLKIQLSGGRPLPIGDIINGKPDLFKVGSILT